MLESPVPEKFNGAGSGVYVGVGALAVGVWVSGICDGVMVGRFMLVDIQAVKNKSKKQNSFTDFMSLVLSGRLKVFFHEGYIERGERVGYSQFRRGLKPPAQQQSSLEAGSRLGSAAFRRLSLTGLSIAF